MRNFSLTVASALALAGCEALSYYKQAVRGQLDLMHSARPVADLLADPATAPRLREELAAAAAIRDFASRELKLPDNASYRRYADLQRPYAVWNVIAAPEFSLRPAESCFPVAGCVAYRGFFSEPAAQEFAGKLRAKGDDVYVAGVPAYSTLGWFDDPLLSTFIDFPEVELARLLFHELAHQRLYVKGDSAFSESFAVTVEREGLRRWLKDDARAPQRRAFESMEERTREFTRLMDAARLELESLYRQSLAADEMRRRKREILAALQARGRTLPGYERLFEREPTNALLAAFATYTQYVPAFERMLREANGDLEVFYARAKELSETERPLREKALNN